MATTYKTPFIQKPDAGFRLVDGRSFWDAIVNENSQSAAYGITATGTTQADAFQLTSVLNEVDTTAASTGVNLPPSSGTRSQNFSRCVIYNNGANALTVYAARGASDTINGTAGATGVSIPAGDIAAFYSAKPGVWASSLGGSAGSFSSIVVSGAASVGSLTATGGGTITTTGLGTFGTVDIAAKGTFVATGSSVTVADTNITANSVVLFGLKTVGGTIAGAPFMLTVTPGTGFTVNAGASDTSTYNYAIIN